MATARFRTEAGQSDREESAAAETRPGRDDRARRVAPGRVAMGVAHYDRIVTRPAARV